MKNHIVYYIILFIFSLLPASCGKILTEDVQPRGEEVELVPTLEDVGTKVSVGSWNTDGYGYGAYHPMSWSNSDRITVVSSQQPTVDCIYILHIRQILVGRYCPAMGTRDRGA